MRAKDRTAVILEAAITLATREGFTELRRDAIATEAGCTFGLVTIRLGTMTEVRRAVMRAAIKRKIWSVLAQGLACNDPTALKAPQDMKDEAGVWLAARQAA